MGVFSTGGVGIDMGSANVTICLENEGVVLREPSYVLALRDDADEILAVGRDARQMLGRTPKDVALLSPVQGGAVADVESAAAMLRSLSEKALGKRRALEKSPLVVALAQGCTRVETAAMENVVRSAGARRAALLRTPVAAALGAAGERFRAFAPGEDSPSERLPGEGDAAAVALLDDANLSDCADPLRGLSIAAEEGRVLVWATLQDEGMPVSARLFDRAFTLRLEAERADSEWKPAETQPIAECVPVSRGALREAFAPQPDAIPETLRTRMDGLRRALGALDVRLSRRTLTALWNACAAEIPRSGRAPSEILDRALAERALPAVLASASMEALTALPKLLEDFPRCRALLRQPLPIRY